VTRKVKQHLYVLVLRLKRFDYAYTVEPRFTNLIRSWRPFVTRNFREPKLLLSHGVLFNNI
jgi:hypothetical protein